MYIVVGLVLLISLSVKCTTHLESSSNNEHANIVTDFSECPNCLKNEICMFSCGHHSCKDCVRKGLKEQIHNLRYYPTRMENYVLCGICQKTTINSNDEEINQLIEKFNNLASVTNSLTINMFMELKEAIHHFQESRVSGLINRCNSNRQHFKKSREKQHIKNVMRRLHAQQNDPLFAVVEEAISNYYTRYRLPSLQPGAFEVLNEAERDMYYLCKGEYDRLEKQFFEIEREIHNLEEAALQKKATQFCF